MPEIILDACVLSDFALSRSFHILKSCYKNQAYVTSFVVAENLKGFLEGYTELDEVKKALVERWLVETDLHGVQEKGLFETLSVSLGSGEASRALPLPK